MHSTSRRLIFQYKQYTYIVSWVPRVIPVYKPGNITHVNTMRATNVVFLVGVYCCNAFDTRITVSVTPEAQHAFVPSTTSQQEEQLCYAHSPNKVCPITERELLSFQVKLAAEAHYDNLDMVMLFCKYASVEDPYMCQHVLMREIRTGMYNVTVSDNTLAIESSRESIHYLHHIFKSVHEAAALPALTSAELSECSTELHPAMKIRCLFFLVNELSVTHTGVHLTGQARQSIATAVITSPATIPGYYTCDDDDTLDYNTYENTGWVFWLMMIMVIVVCLILPASAMWYYNYGRYKIKFVHDSDNEITADVIRLSKGIY